MPDLHFTPVGQSPSAPQVRWQPTLLFTKPDGHCPSTGCVKIVLPPGFGGGGPPPLLLPLPLLLVLCPPPLLLPPPCPPPTVSGAGAFVNAFSMIHPILREPLEGSSNVTRNESL